MRIRSKAGFEIMIWAISLKSSIRSWVVEDVKERPRSKVGEIGGKIDGENEQLSGSNGCIGLGKVGLRVQIW